MHQYNTTSVQQKRRETQGGSETFLRYKPIKNDVRMLDEASYKNLYQGEEVRDL